MLEDKTILITCNNFRASRLFFDKIIEGSEAKITRDSSKYVAEFKSGTRIIALPMNDAKNLLNNN